MATVNLSELEGRLLRPAEPGEFTAAELEGLPEPARRHLAQAIAPGAPLATSARLRMRGHIKVGRWLPFRAREVLDPHHGFVWAARAAGVIAGSDRYLDGVGAMDWKLLGLAAVAHGEGPDQARSAAARAGAEGMWVPTALLPRFGVRWTAGGPDRVTVRHQLGRRRLRSATGWTGPGACGGSCSTGGAIRRAPALRLAPVRRRGHRLPQLRRRRDPRRRAGRLVLRDRPLARRRVLPLPDHRPAPGHHRRRPIAAPAGQSGSIGDPRGAGEAPRSRRARTRSTSSRVRMPTGRPRGGTRRVALGPRRRTACAAVA